ncbi:MAG: transposase [Candidatus Hydrothermarchaeaceae archaeon]
MRLVSPVDHLASLLASLRLTEKSEYSARDYASLVLIAAKLKDYVETISKVHVDLPDVDTLFANLKPRNTLDDLEDVFKGYVTPLVGLLKPKLPSRRYTLAIDITHQPYYGEKPNGWVHAYKPVDGSTGCYKFMVASIVSCSRRFILLALPVPAVSKPMAVYVERLLDYVQPLLPIERVLLDRGFYSFKVIDMLQSRGLKYIVLVPKKKEYAEILERGDGVYHYRSSFPDGKTKKEIGFHFAVARGYQKHDWLLATNMRLKEPTCYVHVYKKRWGIETAFRVQDEVEIKSKSKDMRIRYFLFLFEALVYDLWQYFKGGLSFSSYVLTLHMTLVMEQIEEAIDELLEDRGTRRLALQAVRRGLRIKINAH